MPRGRRFSDAELDRALTFLPDEEFGPGAFNRASYHLFGTGLAAQGLKSALVRTHRLRRFQLPLGGRRPAFRYTKAKTRKAIPAEASRP